MLREAAAMQRALHPDKPHPALAQATDNLAFALMELGKPEEAEPLSRLALSMKRQLYGEIHPETSLGLNNLAYVFEARKRYDDAEGAYRQALAINRQLFWHVTRAFLSMPAPIAT